MAVPANRLLRFFTSGSPEEPKAAGPAPLQPPSGPPRTAIDRANERLIGEISEFLVSSRLAVTSRNLLIAHAAFSGEDPQLGREIGQRRLAGEAITQEWLNEQAATEDQEGTIRSLIAQLEDSLDRFTKTARKARTNTANCNAALAEHVDRAKDTPDSLSLADVLGLANAILDHSRKLEADIHASEKESRNLRERLVRAQRDAEIDHLTGLPNRRAFEAVYERHYREAKADIDQLCVAFCDIDHFKRVNDTHGHETGDRVIQAVAETLNRLSNTQCHVSRHGGEEFVLMFRGMNKTEVRDKLDAVRENFAERRFVNRDTDEPIGQITFSGGVADVFAYPNPREALRAADQALYAAKEQGRNAVLAAP